MVKCVSFVKNFVKSIFVQDESIGLKSIEKIKLEIPLPKKDYEYKISDIMR